MTNGTSTSARTRTLIAALLGLGLAAIGGGIANISPTSPAHGAATQASASTSSVVTATTTVTDTTSTPPPTSEAKGPPAHVDVLIFPDPVMHPGAIDPSETSVVLCAKGFTTKSVRPRTSYTNKLKLLEIGAGGTITAPDGVTYVIAGEQLPGSIADYELDHLISLELGGNPVDPKNLWLEPWERRGQHLAASGTGAESKDVVENRLHREVCAGTVSLTDAQHEIATDWTSAR